MRFTAQCERGSWSGKFAIGFGLAFTIGDNLTAKGGTVSGCKLSIGLGLVVIALVAGFDKHRDTSLKFLRLRKL